MDNRQLSLEEKRRRVAERLRQQAASVTPATTRLDEPFERMATRDQTPDMFLNAAGADLTEMQRFSEWMDAIADEGLPFVVPRVEQATPRTRLQRTPDSTLPVLSFASRNYLGYANHPEVIDAAKAALDTYGMSASGSPVSNGALTIHEEFAQKLLDFWGLDSHEVVLFSSGYGVNAGTIQAFLKPGHHIVLDQAMHMSVLDGAQASRATQHIFRHNDIDHLESILRKLANTKTRILVCTEGIYSADGDLGRVREVVNVSKQYGAYVCVDEAHASLIAGPNGRGVAEAQEVLQDVDLLVVTFSKAFGGSGGALFAPRDVARYVSFYANCRLFSSALNPGLAGGLMKVLDLANSPDGRARRERLHANSDLIRSLLADKVNLGRCESWIVPVIYGTERLMLPVYDAMQRAGLETSFMLFPAVPKGEARARLFLSSEHTPEDIAEAAAIIEEAARNFGFLLSDAAA
jgi:glycine C-acetyltransferase